MATAFLRKTAAVCFSIFLGACAAPQPQGPVRMIHYAPGPLIQGMDQLGELFNTSQKDLQLSMIPMDHESFKTSILTTVTQGTPPELFTYWAGARTEAMVPYLEPLDSLWESQGWDSVFPASVTSAASTYDGKKYLLPMTLQYIGFFYNRQVFQKAGVEPPETWEQFLQTCALLKSRGITPIALGAKDRWPAQFWFDYLTIRTAGPGFRNRLVSGQAKFSSPEVLEVFRLWKELLDRGYFNPRPEDQSWDSFAAMEVLEGRAAMTLNGTWTLGYFQAADPRSAGLYGFFPFPVLHENVPSAAVGYVEGVVLPSGSLNGDGAWEALKFLGSPKAQYHISQAFGSMPPRSLPAEFALTPLQTQIQNTMAGVPDLVLNFDLAAPAAAGEAALNLFREFLRFPDRYPELTAEASRHIEEADTP